MSDSIQNKPKFTVYEQIESMKGNGIRFELFGEDRAAEFLAKRNYFFKVKAFAKNFDKWQMEDGSLGPYMNLDFAYLVELSKLDMRLRSFVLSASLDVEHFLKVRINEAVMADPLCDGYGIVSDFLDYDDARKAFMLERRIAESDAEKTAKKVALLSEGILERLSGEGDPHGSTVEDFDEIRKVVDELTGGIDLRHVEKSISHLAGSSYSRNVAGKYGEAGSMAVWNFMELVPFGELISFYKYFFIERGEVRDRIARKVKPLLFPAKTLRNAAAHNNCILNAMRDRLSKPVGVIAKSLRDDYGYDAELVGLTRRVPVVHDLSALLICYDHIVEGPGIRADRARDMRALRQRLTRHLDFFSKQPEVTAVIGSVSLLLGGFADAFEGCLPSA